jgi:hypothetical protein
VRYLQRPPALQGGHRGAATILTAMVTKLMWMRVIVLAVKGKS